MNPRIRNRREAIFIDNNYIITEYVELCRYEAITKHLDFFMQHYTDREKRTN